MEPKTLFDKIWDAHVVKKVEGGPSVLYIDRHFIHEVTSPQAFNGLKERGIPVLRPRIVYWLTKDAPHFLVRNEGKRGPFTDTYITTLISRE